MKMNFPSLAPFFLGSGAKVVVLADEVTLRPDTGHRRMDRCDALADVITVSSSEITLTLKSTEQDHPHTEVYRKGSPSH